MRKNDLLSIIAIALSVIAIGRTYQMNSFATLIEKLANESTTLTPIEKQELVLQAQKMEQTASMMNTIIQPGTSILKVDNAVINNANVNTANITDANITNATISDASITDADIDNAAITNAVIHSATAGDGDVLIDDVGITIANSDNAVLGFKDSTGARSMYLAGLTNNGLGLFNDKAASNGIRIWAMNNDGTYRHGFLMRDEPTSHRGEFLLTGQSTEVAGVAVNLNNLVELRTQGSVSGSTFMRMRETTVTPDAASNDAFHMYMKGDKLIINSNGKYFYLDLTTSSNQSWIYSAIAP